MVECVYASADAPSDQSLYDTTKFFCGASAGGEVGRYASLESLKMLDTDPQKPFEHITKAMATIFKTPVSLITLVADPSRVWFKSCLGPFGSCVDRDGSWCNYVLVPPTPEILITEDATKDARFAHNPYVAGDPFIKFYAGAPLVGSRGERYGTLCIVDLKQRAFTAELYSLLINFAALAVEEIEVNKPLFQNSQDTALNDTEKNRHLDISLTGSRQGLVMVDVREASWPVVFANPSFEDSSGLSMEEVAGADFWELFESSSEAFAESLGRGADFELIVTCKSSGQRLSITMMPAISDRWAPSKATAIPAWAPSEDAPKGSKLGLDVEKDLMVDVTDRDPNSVPDTKCFWFVIITAKLPSDKDIKSNSTVTSATTASGRSSGRSGSSVASSFSEYPGPASLGDLQLGPLLGSGSFGKVYRCIRENKTVAVKVVDCRQRGDGVSSKQLDEIRLGSSLDHAGVVKVIDHGITKETCSGNSVQIAWIIQEFCDLGTLISAVECGWFRQDRKISASPELAVILPTLLDIANAMAYVHGKSIIHADLTGRNVLLASDPNPRGFVAKICDFGISRMKENMDVASMCSVLGTVTHMPPELLADCKLLPATDMWSFGVIGWEAYHGKRCYCGQSPAQIIMSVTENKALCWPDDALQGFTSLMKRSLAFDHTCRPSFEVMVTELGAFMSAAGYAETAESSCTVT